MSMHAFISDFRMSIDRVRKEMALKALGHRVAIKPLRQAGAR